MEEASIYFTKDLKTPGRDDEAAAALHTVHREPKGNLEVSMDHSYLLD